MKKFVIKFHWVNNSILMSLNQRVGEGDIHPITECFVWPQRDAWEDTKNFLDKRKMLSKKDSIAILNHITEVINCWQGEDPSIKKDIIKLKEKFPHSSFIGRNQKTQLSFFCFTFVYFYLGKIQDKIGVHKN
jgi:30S ribosomal protein 3